MSQPPRPAPSHVPTLTEVIEIPEVPPTAMPLTTDAIDAVAPEPAPAPLAPAVVPAPVPLMVPPVTPAATAQLASPMAQIPELAPEPVPIPASLLKPVSASPPPVMSPVPVPSARSASGVDEAAMAQRVFNEVQRQIDGMLEYRLREALTPILARTAESLVRELRQELSKTMRDVVSRAVAQEVARQRSRS